MSSAKILKNKSSVAETMYDQSFDELPRIKNVAFIKDEIAFVLDDERVIYIPLKWSKKLVKATPEQRASFKTNGIHVFWDNVDEIIGIKNILFGKALFL